MELGAEAAKRAWARLAELPRLEGTQVVVDAESRWGRRGWIAILALDDTITAVVPTPELHRPVADALAGLSPREATSPSVVVPRLPPTRDMLGPASLFYPPERFEVGDRPLVDEVTRADLEELFAAVAPDELEESGLREVEGVMFARRAPTGELAAACGYRRWPNDVAHLSVLAHPRHRGQGHAQHVANAAIEHALRGGFFPQWRARVRPSQALARRLGFVELGAQLSLRPSM